METVHLITRQNHGSYLAILVLLLFLTIPGFASGLAGHQTPVFNKWLIRSGKQNSFQADCPGLYPAFGYPPCTSSGSSCNNFFLHRNAWFTEGLFPPSAQEKELFSGSGDDPGKSVEINSGESPVSETGSVNSKARITQLPELPEIPEAYRIELYRNQNSSIKDKLKRAEALSLTSQIAGMAFLLSIDVWETGRRPLADWNGSLRRAWTNVPQWDDDDYEFNYIGHPYTGAFTYNLMRSQASSPLASWLFSCSQSLIWEFTIEALEEQPSLQDLLITSNVGSLLGEGFHRLTAKMRQNGLNLPEKIIVTIINPGHVLNNGYK